LILGFTPVGGVPRARSSPAGSVSLSRWPSRKAAQHARDRIRQITDRKRLLMPTNDRGGTQLVPSALGGYFRYGNSARVFDAISQYALERRPVCG